MHWPGENSVLIPNILQLVIYETRCEFRGVSR
jgi:hypothetical protein